MHYGYVREYVPSDADEIAQQMRQADRDEVAAHSGSTPYDAVTRGMSLSEIRCTIVRAWGHKPVGVFGVTEDGTIWCLGTDDLTRKPLVYQFMKECRRYVDLLHASYPLLHNVIDARNTVHIKWLRWMGFQFIRRIPHFGVENKPFLEFVRLHS